MIPSVLLHRWEARGRLAPSRHRASRRCRRLRSEPLVVLAVVAGTHALIALIIWYLIDILADILANTASRLGHFRHWCLRLPIWDRRHVQGTTLLGFRSFTWAPLRLDQRLPHGIHVGSWIRLDE